MANDPKQREQDHTLTAVGDTGPTSRPSSPASALSAGLIVGPFRLLERVGEGGMGEVWSADQLEPIRRRVALKVIKRGMDSTQIVARFEAERQALAMMEHPAIARVFDAGTTPDGRPYFAMEYIEGVSITEYCDRHRLTATERLELFCRVCDGVQHAHQKAVIHRDIKPSNILVAMRDGKAEPKIIDFGVAKATAQRLTERTIYTELGAMIGTPEYMSPEQAEMSGQNIDTRTDVYSLGVLLYELLTGALPFSIRELERAGFDEVRRQIREVEPAIPSARLSTLGDRSTTSARNRRSQPGTLTRLIRGDLDWITMKALEKDPARRYGSPSELATDIGRYMQDEPVLAGPPSGLYRARKFARRHRVSVTAAVAGLLALFVFATTTTLQAQRLAAERDRATHESAIAEQTSRFLVGLFRSTDPDRARSITARELLDRGADEIDDGLSDPSVRARVMHAMGRVYGMLGLYSEAEGLQERALDLRRAELGERAPETLASMNDLGLLYLEQARYSDSEELITVALDGRERRLGDDHPDTLETRRALAGVFWRQGRYDEAEPLFAGVFARRRDLLGDEHTDTLNSSEDAATMHQLLGRYDAAEPLFVEVLDDRRRQMGRDHPETLTATANLARFYKEMSRYGDAEELLRQVLDGRRRVLGQDHPDTLASIADLGALYRKQDRFVDAERLHRQAHDSRLRVLGDRHPATLQSMVDLADVYKAQGRLADAVTLLEQVRAGATDLLGPKHPRTLDWSTTLGSALFARGLEREGLDLVRKVLAVERDALGQTHPYTLHAMGELAAILTERYLDSDEGETLLLELLDVQTRMLGEQNHQTLMTHHVLGRWYWRKGGHAVDADFHFGTAADGLERLFGEDHRDRWVVLHSRAQNFKKLYDDERAEELFDEVLAAQRRLLGDDHPDTLTTLTNLGILYQQTERLDDAERLHLEVAATAIALGNNRPGWAPQGSYYQAGCVAAIRGDADQAFAYLETGLASDEYGQFPYWMLNDTDLKSLRKDRRWPDLLAAVGRHRLERNGYDSAAVALLRSAAFRYELHSELSQAYLTADKVFRLRQANLGQDHLLTRSSRNDLSMLAWSVRHDRSTSGPVRHDAREHIGPLGVLEPVAPAERVGVKSTKGETLRAGIIFDNRTDEEVSYYWINWNGIAQHRGTVAPGKSKARSSGPRQAWYFGDALFVTTEQPSIARIDPTPVRNAVATIAPANVAAERTPPGPFHEAARVATAAGNLDEALDYLERALADDGEGQFPSWVASDEQLAPLKESLRWAVFLEDAGRHLLDKHAYDAGALELLRQAAFGYCRQNRGDEASAIGVEIWKMQAEELGRFHRQTRSAGNEAVVLAWSNGDKALAENILGPPEHLDPLAPEGRAAASSNEGETAGSGIIFRNETEEPLDFYWIDAIGKAEHRGTVEPGGSVARRSAPRQAWRLGDAVFVTTDRTSLAVVGN